MSEKQRKPKKLPTRWRDEPKCPVCHGVIDEVENHAECPFCGTPISTRIRTKTEYLILS